MAANFEVPAEPLTQDTPPSWLQWFARANRILNAMQQSGTTANRPTSVLWVGRMYFDKTLGRPVWVQSVKPTVWCDATGAAV